MAAAGLLLLLSTTSSVGEGAAAAAAEPWAPLSWATAGSRLYSFCSNSSGALSPAAVSALGRSAFMIHGMEVRSPRDLPVPSPRVGLCLPTENWWTPRRSAQPWLRSGGTAR